jgi:hypothetical protein
LCLLGREGVKSGEENDLSGKQPKGMKKEKGDNQKGGDLKKVINPSLPLIARYFLYTTLVEPSQYH